jgi:hypothetical protein
MCVALNMNGYMSSAKVPESSDEKFEPKSNEALYKEEPLHECE